MKKRKLCDIDVHLFTIMVKGYRQGSNISATSVLLELVYDSPLVEERVETLVYDAGNFLTAVGGNIGLFLGFSCLSVLFSIIHF